MECLVPDYYLNFSCIAGACRHTCCAGWEIDIDRKSYARYQSLTGAVGEHIRQCISEDGGTPHFILKSGGRCPFLQKDGLCEMILTLGEDSLCQICTDHPRFRNEFSDHTEMGLGLCCEAAGALILKRTNPMALVPLFEDGVSPEKDDEEQSLLSFRAILLSILQDRNTPIDQRLNHLLAACGGRKKHSLAFWVNRFQSLEPLDSGWFPLLEQLKSKKPLDFASFETTQWSCAFEQAGIYFLFRHLPAALDDGDVASKTAFAVLSVRLLRALCAARLRESGTVSLDDFVEFARMYSSEIEYSEENLAQVFSWLQLR